MPEKEAALKKEGQKIHILCPHCRGEMFIKEEGTVVRNMYLVKDQDTAVYTTLPEPGTFQSYDEKYRIICSECDYEIRAWAIDTASLSDLICVPEAGEDTAKA